MVFVAFTQHCMQSTDLMSEMLKILYSVLCIQLPLALPGGKAHCSCTVHPVGLAVHYHAVQRGSFVLKNSGDLSNYKGECRQDVQPIPNS